MKHQLIAFIVLGFLALAGVSNGQDPEPFSFDGEEAAHAVFKIFERSCAECHDGTSRSRSKGSFGTVMDFDAMREDSFLIVPGNADESEIYLLVVDPDPEYVMPPLDSDCPQLTEIESEIVKFWINEGAPSPKTDLEADVPAPPQTEPEEYQSSRILPKAFGRLHVLVVHFPIALIWIALLASLADTLKFAKNTTPVITWCLGFGAVIAFLSVATGWIHSDISGYTDESVFNHRWSGVAVAVTAFLALIAHLFRSPGKKGAIHAFFWITLLASVIAVSLAGHSGGELVYGDETFFDLFR